MPRRWTDEERETLWTCWNQVSAEELAAKLPGRSWESICRRAYDLQLHKLPAKREKVADAAERAGYSYVGFRSLLARHGVTIWRGYKCRTPASSRILWVDPVEVDRAVKADIGLEFIHQAATRLRIGPARLAELVKARGYPLAPGRNRVPTDLLDDVAREYEASRSERYLQRGKAISRARSRRREERQRAA